MKKLIGAVVLGWRFSGRPSLGPDAQRLPAKCRVAEINPVTNHAHCIDPIGAPLEGQQDKPCQGMHQTGQWTMSNGCDARQPADRLRSDAFGMMNTATESNAVIRRHARVRRS